MTEKLKTAVAEEIEIEQREKWKNYCTFQNFRTIRTVMQAQNQGLFIGVLL